ncbi:hypothetical protein A4A49_53886 [Nicotiana attenuata]|uniref:Uncharacterized protein n=1 Tax=Nicotiana attenuata TaxID=49451 RepID=A0A1J6JQI6_NICAT|nr:hypothetical protein A4A49_65543 [Nicotiana attenuata]OIT35506.1 hypothetical protein A4A49_53886 [Nicotiana attenuata]
MMWVFHWLDHKDLELEITEGFELNRQASGGVKETAIRESLGSEISTVKIWTRPRRSSFQPGLIEVVIQLEMQLVNQNGKLEMDMVNQEVKVLHLYGSL